MVVRRRRARIIGALLAPVLFLVGCSSPPHEEPPPEAPAPLPVPPTPPVRRAPSQPLRTTWTFRAGEDECVATAAGGGATAAVSVQRDSPIRLLVSLPAAPVPPAPANTAVRFAGPAGSWQVTARATGRQFAVAIGSDETALSRILVLLSGGTLDLGDPGKPVASLTVSPSDAQGQNWFDCARAKVL